MAYAVVQNTNLAVGTTSTPPTATYTSTPTAGNLLIASVGNVTNTTIPTITDGNSNSWTLLNSINTIVTVQCIALYGFIAGASQSKTVTTNSNSTKNYLNIYEFSGNASSIGAIIDNSQALTGADNTTGTTTQGNQPTVTATNANDLVFTQVLLNGAANASGTMSGAFVLEQFNPATTAWFLADGLQILTSAGAYAPYFSWATGNSRKFQQTTTALLPAGAVAGHFLSSLGAGA